jgi:hypothetical protein
VRCWRRPTGRGTGRSPSSSGGPPGTVRGWLRAFARRAVPVAASARRWTHALDASADHTIPPGSPVVHAVDALGRAARACRLRLEPQRLAVGARCRAHRPAARSPPRPARILSRAAAATREWGRIRSPFRARASAMSREHSITLVASGSTAGAKRSQRATHNRTPPKPAPLAAAIPVPGPASKTLWSFGRSSPTSPSSMAPSSPSSLSVNRRSVGAAGPAAGGWWVWVGRARAVGGLAGARRLRRRLIVGVGRVGQVAVAVGEVGVKLLEFSEGLLGAGVPRRVEVGEETIKESAVGVAL